MGNHFSDFDYINETPGNCQDMTPFRILFHKGNLNGLVWQNVGDMPGSRYSKNLMPLFRLIMTCLVVYICGENHFLRFDWL